MLVASWRLPAADAGRGWTRWFRRLQLVSAALYSLGHGGNDAQKTMGIIAALLYRTGHAGRRRSTSRSGWCSPATRAIGLGTLFGGWRIVKTMGHEASPSCEPVGGFCAETGGAHHAVPGHRRLGIPVSTTHTITGAIVGVGVGAPSASAVRWGVAGRHRLGPGSSPSRAPPWTAGLAYTPIRLADKLI
ncbi:MAG: inorganic phosphate transporter [Rhodopseudomonas palustris]|nr:inorganic phosphate transporter [Rhodopseudomonas palustris]